MGLFQQNLIVMSDPTNVGFPASANKSIRMPTPTPDPVAEYTAERTSKCVDVCVHNTILLGFYLVVLKKFSQISQHHSVADD